MIYIDAKQGSEDWHKARVGVITASRCKDACDRLKNGDFSQKALGYAAQIAMERITGTSCDDTFVNYAMRRGAELEAEARMAYEAATGNFAQEVGIYLTDDRLFGYSSDGLIGEDGLLEIKCPLSPLGVLSVWNTSDLSDYVHQMQKGLWITGRKWIDFVMYDPRLAPVGKELYINRRFREEEFIDKMVQDLLTFNDKVKEFEHALKK